MAQGDVDATDVKRDAQSPYAAARILDVSTRSIFRLLQELHWASVPRHEEDMHARPSRANLGGSRRSPGDPFHTRVIRSLRTKRQEDRVMPLTPDQIAKIKRDNAEIVRNAPPFGPLQREVLYNALAPMRRALTDAYVQKGEVA